VAKSEILIVGKSEIGWSTRWQWRESWRVVLIKHVIVQAAGTDVSNSRQVCVLRDDEERFGVIRCRCRYV